MIISQRSDRRLEELCRRWENVVHWREGATLITYGDLREDLHRARSFLGSLGLKEGDAVALYGLGSYETWLAVLAGQTLGLLMAPLPSRLKLPQLDVYLRQLPFRILIASKREEVRDLELVTWKLPPSIEGREPLVWDEQRAGLVIFSSGSSGIPKGLVHTPGSLSVSAQATLDFYQAETGDSWLLSLDLSHIGGLQIAWRCLLGGLTCLGGYAPNELDLALQQYHPRFLSLVPTQLQRLLNQAQACDTLRKSKAILLGGAASSAGLVSQAHAERLPISLTYGSSEAASQICATPIGNTRWSEGEVGPPLPIWTVELRHHRIALQGAALFQGWWQEACFHPRSESSDAGWYLSPDRGEWVGGGLRILDRQDTVFQVAGENLAPTEITKALEPLAYGGDWIVIPWPDEDYGEVPWLIARGLQTPPDHGAVQDILVQALPRIKHPRRCYWHRTDEAGKPSQAYYRTLLKTAQDLELRWIL